MFLHTFYPSSILISIGPVNVYWYGLFIVLGMLLGIIVSLRLANYYSYSKDTLIDIIFWLIIWGVVGARLYDVLIEFNFYKDHPLDILKIWQGGLAIHGAIIAGVIVLYYFGKKHQLSFWKTSSILLPGVALAQAIGRWGNYFNQELFGKPTSLPWGIPIEPANRPLAYFTENYFHPAFLYESLGDLAIFLLLYLLHRKAIKNGKEIFKNITLYYIILYAVLRFFMEFIRIDATPLFLWFRLPQVVSIISVIIAILLLFSSKLKIGKKAIGLNSLEKNTKV